MSKYQIKHSLSEIAVNRPVFKTDNVLNATTYLIVELVPTFR